MKDIVMTAILFSAIMFTFIVINLTVQNIIFNLKKDATGYYIGYQNNTVKIIPPLHAMICSILWAIYFAF